MIEWAEEPIDSPDIDVLGKVYEVKPGNYTFQLHFQSNGYEHIWHSPSNFTTEKLALNVMNYIGETVIQVIQFRIGVICGNRTRH